MTRIAVLRYGRSGLVGAIILGLGRALGETMAVTMVIGNRPEIALSLFAPGYTMASVIANEFTEATSDLYLAALIEIGLLLLRGHGGRQRARAPAGLVRRRRGQGGARMTASGPPRRQRRHECRGWRSPPAWSCCRCC